VKILFFSHYFVPENNAPAARVHSMAREWVKAGHEVTVVTCAPNVPNGVLYPGYRNRLYQRQRIDGIRVLRVWTYLAPNKGTVKRIINFLSYFVTATVAGLLAGDADVVVGTSPQFFAGWAGLAVARAKRRPYVLEIRDIWPESITTVGAMQNGALVRLLERLEERLYRWSTRIIVVGDGYRDRLVQKGVPAAKIAVISNGVDGDLFAPRPADPEVRRAWGLRNDQFVCVSAGTIGMASGLDVVIRAARLLKEEGHDDIAFVLIGDGATRADLVAQTREYQLDNVVLPGLQPRQRLPELLAAADACLVHLHEAELFTTIVPSKFFEDAAMEKPIVLGIRGHAERMVREAACGLVFAPDDEHGLVAAVTRLAADPDLARQLGANGRAYVVKHFDRRTLAADYLRRLETVVASPSSSIWPAAAGT
jgi:glycosyltransferase involved in cell wall biosynthesis